MSQSELPPIPADIAALLAQAGAPVPPPGFHDAVLAKVSGTLAGGGAAGGGAAASALGQFGGWLAGGTLLLGLAVGVLVAPVLRPAPVPPPVAPVAIVPPPEPAVTPQPAPIEPERKAPPLRRATPPVAAPVVPPPAAAPQRDTGLAEERALVEMARTALARGDAAQALQLMDNHVARFAQGQLIEERESLVIEAYLAAGKREEAKLRAEAFRKRFPQSMLLPSVEAAFQ